MISRLALRLLFIFLPALSLTAPAQPPPATLRSLLLHELRTTHTKAEWFVPINTAVEGLTAEQANWQPPLAAIRRATRLPFAVLESSQSE